MKNELNKIALVITGCIQPNSSVPFLTLHDPVVRRNQYIESIKYYITKTIAKNIIYCDNSMAEPEYNLFDLAKEHNKKFEWISFEGDSKKSIQLGKGYGEGEIMNHVLNNSEVLKDCNVIVKVTGRLKVLNFNLIIKHTRMDNTYFVPSETNDNRHYINTRFYMIPKKLYSSFFDSAYMLVNDRNGIYLEHAFAMCADREKIRYKKFIFYPKFEGVSGSTGKVYTSTKVDQIKNTIKMHRFKVR